MIIDRLRGYGTNDRDLLVVSLDNGVSTDDGGKEAHEALTEYGASLVLYGWYQKIEDKTTASLKLNYDEAKLKCFEINRPEMKQASDESQFLNKDFLDEISKQAAFLGFYGLGYWHYRLKNYEGAASAYQYAIQQSASPKAIIRFNDVYYYLGDANYAQGNLDESLRSFEIYKTENPNQLSVHNALGLVYYGKGNVERAIEEFNLAIAPPTIPNPTERAEYYYNRGNAFLRVGRLAEAKADYRQATNIKNAKSCNDDERFNTLALTRLKELGDR